MGDVWFVKVRRGTSGRCVVCMGDGVETRVTHDKTNGRWKGRRSLGYDKLRDMGHLVPMRKEA
jgi:hypothetical protein